MPTDTPTPTPTVDPIAVVSHVALLGDSQFFVVAIFMAIVVFALGLLVIAAWRR